MRVKNSSQEIQAQIQAQTVQYWCSVILAVTFIIGCSTTPFSSTRHSNQAQKKQQEQISPHRSGSHPPVKTQGQNSSPELLGYTQLGNASWYGKRFHGRKTASGEIYNMHALTAAHKYLPMGTIVNVRSLSTGKTVQVRINDRGPFTPKRIIDLSREAARRIGLLNRGTDRVEIEVIALPDSY